MYEKLKIHVDGMSGTFVGIGVDDILKSIIQTSFFDKIKFINKFSSKITADNLICNYESVKKKIPAVMKLTKKINSHIIYVYGTNKKEILKSVPNNNIVIEEFEDGVILKIEYLKIKKDIFEKDHPSLIVGIAEILESIAKIWGDYYGTNTHKKNKKNEWNFFRNRYRKS